MMQGDYNDSQKFPVSKFEAMLKTNDLLFFDADEFELIICHYLELGRMGLAKKGLRMGLNQHPSSTALKLLEVEVLLFENKLDEADDNLSILYDLEPSNPEIYLHKANIFSKRDQHNAAIDLLKSAAEILEDASEVYAPIAMEYMFLENYDQAKHYYIKCLDIDDDDISALYNIIYCFDFLEQPEEAISFLNTYLDNNPYSEIGWHQIGLQYVKLQDSEKALSSFDFAIISDDYFVGAYMEKAKVLEEIGHYEDAIECYKTTLELEDPTAFAYLRIGKCYEYMKQDSAALTSYNKSLQEDPLLDKTWLAITDFYYSRNAYKQALHYIEKAIEVDEENPLYWERHTQINSELKRFQQAEDNFIKSIDADQELESCLMRSDILIDLQQYETAQEVLEQAEKTHPYTAEIQFRLAGLQFSINQENTGVFHLKKGLKINRSHAFILKELFPGLFQQEDLKLLILEAGFPTHL